ncbi:Putative mitochondrial inner membrane transporter [Komagataella phaffii CBS 7435]|uniref:Mitochondrial protein, putative inner membrane transporter n=2 Tax=Komagataella phaffii TaxID=460519 RepID=C4QX05_KOMPG|nr:Mitochondrial protein, putative inner membrane transporter [Komagataella phaffii GS115]AOA60908.1 GQ67_02246T0 [Komagataella phaffii]CAH2446574.1 Putative mitochondrial inner membrane transporter [Komagataella phaffii CBS 7435]AOA66059.1 GQ68_02260T0 [Komagataella phaffii GS115]CAY67778.1 Mitochondrial protein, putative inner membrane transporter [Komagataella phaffii GS115]CCA36863.1 Putative mitochondrial inner membrane transporter [Komagataella phaffii CBS 7435]
MSQDHLDPEKRESKYIGFVAGCFSGITKNFVGHPFDTVKVRLQTAEPGRFSGPLNCCVMTLKNEGLFGFFKGALAPMYGWLIMDSVMLGSLHLYKQLIKDRFYPEEKKLPMPGLLVAAVGSGWTVSFVAAPVETIKARLQIQYDAKSKVFDGPTDCLIKLLRYDGLKTLYRGLIPTMIFRTNFVFWWGSYDLITDALDRYTTLSKPAVNFWAGGLGASVFWTFAYPADVIKQTIMTDNVAKPRFRTYSQAVRYIYTERGGMKGFFRGYIPTMLRSFPANASALAAFEFAMRLMHVH